MHRYPSHQRMTSHRRDEVCMRDRHKRKQGELLPGSTLSGKGAQGWQRRWAGGNLLLLQPAGRHFRLGELLPEATLSGKGAQGCRRRWAGGNRFLLQPAGRRRVHSPRVAVVACIASLGGKRLQGRCEGGWGPASARTPACPIRGPRCVAGGNRFLLLPGR